MAPIDNATIKKVVDERFFPGANQVFADYESIPKPQYRYGDLGSIKSSPYDHTTTNFTEQLYGESPKFAEAMTEHRQPYSPPYSQHYLATFYNDLVMTMIVAIIIAIVFVLAGQAWGSQKDMIMVAGIFALSLTIYPTYAYLGK